MKGKRVYASFDEAKAYVLGRRVELRNAWLSNTARPLAHSAKA
jgi:hypothetical protein